MMRCIQLIGSIDPNSDTARGLHAKALRSLGIGVGEITEKEKQIRERRREKLKTEFIPLADVAELPGTIPGLGPPIDEASDAAMPIPIAALSIMAEKLARGCEYNYQKQQRFVEDPYGIRTFVSEPGSIPNEFAGAAENIDFGPACQIARVFAKEDPGVVLYWIAIWTSLYLHVRIDYDADLKQMQFTNFQGIILPEGKSSMAIPDYLRDYQKALATTQEGAPKTQHRHATRFVKRACE